MDALREILFLVVRQDRPMTVRQVFYRMVSIGAIGKTEAEYKNVVIRLLADLRLSGLLPFEWIADNTRWQRKPRTYSSLEAALENTARTYRRALWDTQERYVEVWLEKEALAGVLLDVTDPFDVPLMVTRGYSSLSYLYRAAEDIVRIGKPAVLLYFGDHDPSGVDIPRNVMARLEEFAPTMDIEMRLIAVTRRQIEEMDLPTRPTKRTDSRSAGFRGESVEVDAIPPAVLRDLARAEIEAFIEPRELAVVQAAERSERALLERIAVAKPWE
ncbi:MAG: hypothetical protein ABFS86_16475 [Planctomycetota bacterium]